MNGFYENLQQKFGKRNFSKIQNAKIGIAGCGGLGSNCAQYLVRSGIKDLVIVDFDLVSDSNLDRQFYFKDQIGMVKTQMLKQNLLRINPEIDLTVLNQKIEQGQAAVIFKDCVAIAECFDRAEYKKMIVEELVTAKKFVVAVSGLGGIGKSDEIKVKKISSGLVMIGDGASDIAQFPAFAPRVSIAAAKQADELLSYIITL